MSGVVGVAVSPCSWKNETVRLGSNNACSSLEIPSAAAPCSAPSSCDLEVPSSMARSAVLAPFDCECSASAPEVIGSDKATFASSAIAGCERAVTMEMVGENSERERVNTRL